MICADTRVTILCLKVSKIRHMTLEMAAIFKNGLQNGGYNGMIISGNSFSEIYAPENLYMESTMIALRLLVSEIW